ncbi:unnamed protein product, partial [Scytosiphon promiscuus]
GPAASPGSTPAPTAPANQNDRTGPSRLSSSTHDCTRDSTPSSQLSTSNLHRHHLNHHHHHHDYPSTPSFLATGASLGDTDFPENDPSRVWSESSFANAAFSPDPVTPGSGGGNGSNGRGGGADAAEAPPTAQGGDAARSSPVTEMGRGNA